MPAEAQLSKIDFWEQLIALEGRLTRREVNGTRSAFGTMDDDLFAYLLRKDFEDFPHIKSALPDWPSEEIRRTSSEGFSLHDSVNEAVNFWKAVKSRYEAKTLRRVANSMVADYGAGWGRITRLCAKDVGPGRLTALEPNPLFCDLFEKLRVEANLTPTDWASEKPLSIRDVDLVICFSVFTHASRNLARNMFERFKEMTKPGGIIALTIRPGAYLRAPDGEMSHFGDAERADALSDYDAGELVFKPYREGGDWGVAIAPMTFLRALCGDAFAIDGPYLFLQNWTQTIVYLERR